MSAAAGGPARPGAAWALPGALFFLVFAVVPLLLVGYLSLTSWEGLGAPRFTGAQNWVRLAGDPVMRQAVVLSAALTAATWLVQTPISLLLGVWAAGPQRNRAVLSAVFFTPLLFSSAAVAIVWKTLLDPNFGPITRVGPWLGLPDANVLGSSAGAFLAVVFVSAWQFIPLHTLIYQGGARQIPAVLYGAAEIDGAGRFRRFWHVTLPQLRHTITTSSVLMVVGALTYFETVLILTQGGPGTDTSIVPYLMYRVGFAGYEMGYASAIAATLVVAATGVSLLLVRFTGFAAMRSTREGM
ncbi:carbohydrate ABC transporter permease [Marinitenerispora sediminis]|uniref:ABC transporter n=1 Tax=Marinitenerispora sediminis TaxID=1931232 RepID=A0A368T3V9_9ACTN|nr:sugar ABC transporter permease [Marinitenerispora sediminis]RCV54100.1 ABC transporter [Marinitenerispora sediminis]RCV56823.1 ABC transporter [Marinitenerispora sediminis]RCV56946.1 ABC transporter [Marinitenerispora sediminis]